MTKENKDLLMKLLQQHKALGISDQIDNHAGAADEPRPEGGLRLRA